MKEMSRKEIKNVLDNTNIKIVDEIAIIEYIDYLIEELNAANSRLSNYSERIIKALRLLKHNDIYDYSVFEDKMENILEGKDNEI